MNRLLQRLDVVEQPRAHRARRRLPGGAVGAIVVMAVVGALLLSYATSETGATPVATGYGLNRTILLDTPTTTHIESKARLIPAPAASFASSAYTVMHTVAGRPVMWEPCRAIHYVVRQADEPASFDSMLEAAVDEVSRVTGLKFVNDGPTSELLLAEAGQRRVYQPRTYGDRWAPVLVAWASSAETNGLAGSEAGFAGADVWSPPDGPSRYVSGVVAFNVADLLTMSRLPRGATLVHDVLLHEFGHLVGLGHANDRSQIMFPTLTHPMPGYGEGDLAGLSLLGKGPCYTDF